jgi:hypothetical protein
MMLRAIGLAFVALLAGGYALRCLASGAINLGTKTRENIVRFADEPGLFVFGIVFMLSLCVGGLLAAYQMWRKSGEAG